MNSKPTILNSKPVFRSKTFWLQVVAFLSVLIPPVQQWLAENPVEFVAVLTALNTLVRFATQDKIQLFLGNGSSRLPSLLLLCGVSAVAVGTMTGLSSCGMQARVGYDPITGKWTLTAHRPIPVNLDKNGTITADLDDLKSDDEDGDEEEEPKD